MKASVEDLSENSKELLEIVARGEEVIIIDRGKPCAKLVPLIAENDQAGIATPLFGIWKDREDMPSVEKYARELRKTRF